MRNFCLILLLAIAYTNTHAQDAYRYRLLANWNNPNLSTNPDMPDQVWNELTGWADTINGKEYIIMASIDSIYFFDVTDPTNIKLCDVHWGLNRVINRDVEVYSHFLYAVSDSGPPGKLQIFDLSYLPDSAHKIYESDEFGHLTHSMFINPVTKRLYMCSNRYTDRTEAMVILSIDTPNKPSYLGKLNVIPFGCQRVHEVYIRNDTAFCSCEYLGLFVYDLTDVNQQKMIGAITPPYPYNGYNHTNWTDSGMHHIALTDELPSGLPLKIFRIRSFDDMTYLTHFNTNPGATPHNVFWVGNLLYVSWYHDGVYALDMTNPRFPKVHAFYDTYHQNDPGDYSGFRGCWGVFPYLPSGNIAASDMTNGLFMLRFDATVGLHNEPQLKTGSVLAYPNPTNSKLSIDFQGNLGNSYTLKVFDSKGKLHVTQIGMLNNEENGIIIEAFSGLKAGLYVLHVDTETGPIKPIKVVKQ